jgi:hypothetical protein
MADKMASSGEPQSQAKKAIASQSKQQVPQGAFESQLQPQPLAPLPNTLNNTAATPKDEEAQEKQDPVN